MKRPMRSRLPGADYEQSVPLCCPTPVTRNPWDNWGIQLWLGSLVAGLLALQVPAAELKLSLLENGDLAWTNVFTNGICTLERAATLSGDWTPVQNFYTTNLVGQARLLSAPSNGFYRLLAVDISSNAPSAYSNLVGSYGILRTVAGNGAGRIDGTNYWQDRFEGGPATSASLSRPHFAMADNAGNIFIVDKDSHSVLKVTTDGLIHTVTGTHTGGFNGDGPDYGTNLQLNFPNGLWVRGDGTVYILDTGNDKVRRLAPDGIMTTLFTASNSISGGRGLWVSDDESTIYFVDGTNVRKWAAGAITKVNSKNFNDPGNLVVNPKGELIVTDRGANRVYRLNSDGSRDVIAGNGTANSVVEGTSALTNGVYGVRGVWYLPNDGYLLATHEGSQVLYVDPAGMIHVFVDGAPGHVHSGDGEWFHSPGFKISEVRGVTMDSQGNILITENDYGYVRKIEFLRLTP